MPEKLNFEKGAKIAGRLFLAREGALHTELFLPQNAPMILDCESRAQVKMKLLCQFYYSGKIDFYKDRLAPFLCVDGKEYPLGQYVFARCKKQQSKAGTLWHVTGLDLCYLAKKHKLENAPYWGKNTPYTLAIEQMLFASGLVNYMLESSNLLFATEREDWPRGESALTIANSLLKEMAYNSIFCDFEGVVRATKFGVPGECEATVKYTKDDVDGIFLPGAEVEFEEIYRPNVFYYSCENPELEVPMTVKVENTSVASPYSVQNQGRVPVFRTVDNAANLPALQAMAEKELFESLRAANEITFYTGLCPKHSAFDVVQLEKNDFFGTVHEEYWKMTIAPGGLMKHRGRVIVQEGI